MLIKKAKDGTRALSVVLEAAVQGGEAQTLDAIVQRCEGYEPSQVAAICNLVSKKQTGYLQMQADGKFLITAPGRAMLRKLQTAASKPPGAGLMGQLMARLAT